MSDSLSLILDLTGRTPLSPENANALNELAIELRPRIVELIDQMSLEQSSDIDWWVTPLASRNPFASQLFLSCCRIALLDRLLATQKVPMEVLVDSRAMVDLASRLGSRHRVKLRIRIDRLRNLRDFFWRPTKSLLTAIFHVVVQFFCAKFMLSRPPSPGDAPLIVVDTFLYSVSVHNGTFYDRHFPDIADSLTTQEYTQLLYFPTFYKIRNYPKIFFRLRGLREKFIFKEDYLHLRDYLFAFGHGFRIGRIRLDAPMMLNGLPLNTLMCEELRRGWMRPSAIEALLKYRAICRMSETGVKIKRVLDWFENQDIDRGANAGYRRYYPNIEVVGYIGYIASQHYLCMYPSPAEEKAKVLPTRFAVIGKGFVETIKEFCPDLVVEVAPALRYVAPPPFVVRSAAINELSILVALPVMRVEVLEILATIQQLLHGLNGTSLATTEVQILIKPHPASDMSRNDTLVLAPDSKGHVTWVDEKLDTLLLRADVMVSSASSACFEALTMDVPTIVIGSCYGLTYAPIPQGVPQDRWKICFTWEDMLSAIITFRMARDAWKEKGFGATSQLRDKYLEPVSRNGVRRLVLGGV